MSNNANTAILKIESSMNPMLKAGATRQDASFFVTPVGFDGAATIVPSRLKSVIIDISGSMAGNKINAAFEGAKAFLDALLVSPKDYFSVYLFGKGKYRLIHPTEVSEANIRKAKAELDRKLNELVRTDGLEGNTYTSGGMQLFREDFESLHRAGKVTEALAALLTDGDYSDHSAVKDEIVAYQNNAKAGKVAKIYARGVGTDWKVDLLRLITDGTLSAPPVLVVNPSDIKTDFQAILAEAAAQKLSGVTMVIQKFNMGEVLEIGVRAPVNLDLASAVVNEGEKKIKVNLGSWDNETRLFYLAFEVSQPGNAPAIMAAKIWFEYMIGGTKVSTEAEALKVTCQWARNSEEATLSQRVARGVKLAQGIEGSQRRIREAAALGQKGDIAGASNIVRDLLVDFANDPDNGPGLIEQLKEFIDIEDAATGKFKFKAGVDAAAFMKLDTKSSVRRVRTTGDAAANPEQAPTTQS